MKPRIAFIVLFILCLFVFVGCEASNDEVPLPQNFNPSYDGGPVIQYENGSYWVCLPISGQRLQVRSEYSGYFGTKVTDGSIRSAEERIERMADTVGHPHYYLTVDEEGYLCLAAELIKEFPAKEPGMSGCNIDHEHLFYQERISS